MSTTNREHERQQREVQGEAFGMLAARGQFSFNLDDEDVKRLYRLAGIRRQPVDTMVRDWVLDCLAVSENIVRQAKTKTSTRMR